jgi:hypothetical protein
MANHNCNQNCGCTDTYTVSAPCPPSCAEVFNAQCIVYTGTDLVCGKNTVIRRYDYLDTIITKLVNYICSNFTLPAYNVVGSENITVTTTTIGNTTTFTLLALETILVNTDNLLNITTDTTPGIDIIYTVNIDVPALINVIPLTAVAAGPSANSFITSSVVGNLTTYSVDSKESIVAAGTGVSVVATGGGAPNYDTTYTVSAIPTFTYEIGEYVASEGGVIMHRWLSTISGGTPAAGTSQNYIVVDLNDLALAQWATINVDISNVESTYDGQFNTTNLIAAGAPAGITVGTAAELCDSSTAQGKTDWYLPSIDELVKLHSNRWEVAQGLGVGGGLFFQLNNYWSSTEANINNAWNQSFLNGGQYINPKVSTDSVRAVRRFSI